MNERGKATGAVEIRSTEAVDKLAIAKLWRRYATVEVVGVGSSPGNRGRKVTVAKSGEGVAVLADDDDVDKPQIRLGARLIGWCKLYCSSSQGRIE